MATPPARTASKTAEAIEQDVALLARRHSISPAIPREIMRRSGSTDRMQVEREIARGKARR